MKQQWCGVRAVGPARVAAGVVAIAMAGGAASAQTVVDWLSPVSGVWSDPLRWSGGVVPNNSNPGAPFAARILTPGLYDVTLDINVSLSGFRLAATGASLTFSGANRSLATGGINVFDGVDIQGDTNSSINATGQTTLSGGGQIFGIGGFTLGGTVDIIDVDDWDLCDTCLDLNATANWSGTGGFNLMNDAAQSEILIGAAGTLTLTGAGSRQITATNSINRVVNNGSLVLQFANATDTLTIDTATLTNGQTGTISIKRGKLSTNVISGGTGGALSGGRWQVENEGEAELVGLSVIELAADVELIGAGSRFDALSTLSLISSQGSLAISEGRDFTTQGDLRVTGAARVGVGSTLDVSGSLTSIGMGTLQTGDFEVFGTLIADAARVSVVESRLVVGRSGQLISREAGGDTDGLSFLTRVAAGGELGLVGGRVLDLTPAGNVVVIEGRLVLGASETLTDPGSTLAVAGYTQAAGSELLIGIGSTTNFGTIQTNELVFGTGAAGDTAGTLRLILDPGYAAAFGDEFLLFDLTGAAGVIGGGFAAIDVQGMLPGGLFFEQFSSAAGLGVRVVPAPGAAAVLMGGIVVAGRRRR